MSSSANFFIRAEVPHRKSPAATPRIARQLKLPVADSDAKTRSPKVPDRKSPRSTLAAEKKQPPGRVAQLESKLAQLQEDYKRTKDQLSVTKKQLAELTDCDDARIEELRKISHDRDRVWQSELESIQKQHSIDSAALSTAMNEIKRLKNQLQIVSESEATQMQDAESAHDELQGLRMELKETLSLVERMKSELSDCRRAEAEAKEAASETRTQLEASKSSGEKSRLESIEAMEACKRLVLELEQSRAEAKSLEELVRNSASTNQLKAELKCLKSEVSKLRSDLQVSEARYQDEYIQSTLEIRSAYEQVERTKHEAAQKEAQLTKARAEIEELNEAMRSKIKENQYEEELKKLKERLKKKEAEVESLAERNETLEEAKGVNEEMEGELRRLKVQADQWRKAAEAAASMLSNGKFVERRGGSFDNHMDSPFSEEMEYEDDEDEDDECVKKKNGNVLKKIGVLWKKGHK
ncbi:Interactor of constitutive active ROPs 2, chloroplastic [Linum perenne]